MNDLKETRQIHQIRPGDRILLTVSDGFDASRAQHLAEQLKERFPDVEFTVLAGLEVVGVQRKED